MEQGTKRNVRVFWYGRKMYAFFLSVFWYVMDGTKEEPENDAPRVLVCYAARDEEVRTRVF